MEGDLSAFGVIVERHWNMVVALALVSGVVSVAHAAGGQSFLTAKAAGPDFVIQGEYTGVVDVDGEQQKWGVQVIALGDDKFRAVGFRGGLPGDGWDGEEPRRAEGKASGGVVTIDADEATLEIAKGTLKILGSFGEDVGHQIVAATQGKFREQSWASAGAAKDGNGQHPHTRDLQLFSHMIPIDPEC